MSLFKLLAIVPLAGCPQKFCKSLTPGTPYTFYQDYKVTMKDDSRGVLKVERNENIPTYDHLFQLNNGIQLQINAVVGKNGTGKSTIYELLYYFIYLLGLKKRMDKDPLLHSPLEELIDQRDEMFRDSNFLEDRTIEEGVTPKYLAPELNLKKKSYSGYSDIRIALHLIQKHKLNLSEQDYESITGLFKQIKNALADKLIPLLDTIRKFRNKESFLKDNFAVSIIYEIDHRYYEAKYISGRFSFQELRAGTFSYDEAQFHLEKFFYTISLNYSHHSLNANTMGSWINRLFHKNDAYRTPVVINPMRTGGNFDINKEIELSKERLMSNLVYGLVQDREYLLLHKYSVERFVFGVKAPKQILSIEQFLKTFEYKELLAQEEWDRLDEGNSFIGPALIYLKNKINRIKDNYHFLFPEQQFSKADFIVYLKEDSSHITKKVRQTLNFLKYMVRKNNLSIWKPQETKLVSEMTPTELLVYLGAFDINAKEMSPSELIEYALPGFMKIDFKFTNTHTLGNDLQDFDEFSSGEQQVIFNIQSILYHLYNLDSVHYQKDATNAPERIRYEHVNVVLDEMELYYHPEWQRSFIYELHQGLSNLKPRKNDGIKGINISILTHSPFILSDIPASNILKLPLESEEKHNQSFAANIHDILADNFFLENGLGKYAEKCINKALQDLNAIQEKQEKDPNYILENEKILEIKNLIRLIEEPILRNKMTEMVHQIDPDPDLIEEIIEKETAYLRNIHKQS